MLKNKLYRIDKWISKDNRVLLVLLLLVVAPVVMIQFTSTMFYGIGLFAFICLWVVFVKAKILGGQWKFDKSIYDVPQVEEIVVTTKNFYWDGSLKSYHVQSHTSKPNTVFIEKGTELKIIHLRENDDDCVLMLKKGNGEIIITVNYLESKDYYKTKSQIREDKLKKLLK